MRKQARLLRRGANKSKKGSSDFVDGVGREFDRLTMAASRAMAALTVERSYLTLPGA
jgi:hypothetical protein